MRPFDHSHPAFDESCARKVIEHSETLYCMRGMKQLQVAEKGVRITANVKHLGEPLRD